MAAKRVLVVVNFDNTELGQVRTALDEAGAAIDERKVHQGVALPENASGYDAVVVLGGGQNALDDEKYPYMPSLLELMRDFERQDKAVLGICLGSQLLARAFGAENKLGTAREFGWHEVSLTENAKDDPVLRALPASFPIFQWHDDTFTLPPSAMRLATNGAVENQAFRIGRAAYGMQFHFEADRKLVRDWNEQFAHLISAGHPEWPARFEDEAARHGPGADAAGLQIARAWVATI